MFEHNVIKISDMERKQPRFYFLGRRWGEKWAKGHLILNTKDLYFTPNKIADYPHYTIKIEDIGDVEVEKKSTDYDDDLYPKHLVHLKVKSRQNNYNLEVRKWDKTLMLTMSWKDVILMARDGKFKEARHLDDEYDWNASNFGQTSKYSRPG